MTDTDTTVAEFTEADAKTLAKLQSVQKANYGRMRGAQNAIASTDEKIVDLQNRRWSIEPMRDFVAEDAYDEFKALMSIHGSDAAHRYRHDYVLSLDPHFNYEEWEPATNMPVIRLEVAHDDSDAMLLDLGEHLMEWTRFRYAHEVPPITHSDDIKEVLDVSWSVEFKILDWDIERFPAHRLLVFADATAQRVEKRWGASLALDTERRPLFDVLIDVREHWYYPASSNPEHAETTTYFGLPDTDEDFEVMDPDEED